MSALQLISYCPPDLATAGIAAPAFWARTSRAGERFADFFTSNIRNRNTRRAYAQAVSSFTAFCEGRGLADSRQVKPIHVAAFIEDLTGRHKPATVKQQLAPRGAGAPQERDQNRL